MKNLLIAFLILTTLNSCSQNQDLIDTIEQKWSLQRVEGSSSGIEILSIWQTIQIKDGRFTLYNISDIDSTDEEEIASGSIEICESRILNNCYNFIVETKTIDQVLALELSSEKIVTYLNDELSFTAVCCNDVSYFLN